MDRRTFAKNSSYLLSGITILPSLGVLKVKPSDQIRIGVIGANGMGWSNVNALLSMPEVECVAICDVDDAVISRRLADYKKLRENKPDTYKDYRVLLDRDDIDAVVIGTPDHWHARMMVDAVASGKHVYVEKPVANSIEECNIMVDAAKHYQKVVQCGQWQRSGPHYSKAVEIVQSGVLGNIRLVKVWAYQGWMEPVPVLPDSKAPKGVDYKMWLGPAQTRPFNKNRFHFNFRWFWDYAGGLMTDWGVHEIDIALLAMQAEAPISVMASGGKLAYPDDASETPDTLQTVYQYDGFNMLWEHATGIDNGPYGRTEGIAFIGNNGTLVVNRQGYELLVEYEREGWSNRGPQKMETIESFEKPGELNYLQLHAQNFVEAMKNNDPSILNTAIDSGAIAAINAQMGNIAFKTGRKLYWEKEKGMFKDDNEANKYLKAQYHNGWEFPMI